VRLLLLGGSVAVAILLFRGGRLTAIDQNRGVVTLILVGGFLVGAALSVLMAWWRDRGHRPPRIVEDVRAVVSLAAGGFLVFLVVNRLWIIVPPAQIDAFFKSWVHVGRFGPEHLLAAVVGFYFGSRS
jgi:hypothetical protein